MLTPGVIVIACLLLAFPLFLITGLRLLGWGSVLLGGLGLGYSIWIYPELISIAVGPISVLLIAIGLVAVAVRRYRHYRLHT